MTMLRSNLLANFAGAGWGALVGLACTPIYIRLMGIEAYGLIGFFIMLQSTLQVLDLGLSPTINREMARYSIQPGGNGETRDFVRTFGLCSWAMGFTVGMVVWAVSPIIASQWIKTSGIPNMEVQKAISLMAVLIALQWPISCYTGGLLGLQRQVILNILRITIITLGSGGAILVLWLVSPNILTFFSWQILVCGIQVALMMLLLDRTLPFTGRSSRFNPSLIRNVWRFAAGMSGITLSALILTQLDKIILSKLLNLKMFGYYALAGVVSNGLYIFITPVFNATFPRFSALVASNSEDELKHLYHVTTQLMSVLVFPVAAVLSFFSFEIISLWTGDAETARHTSPIVSAFVIGTALNGVMFVPYSLQLAYGWTKIGLYINAFLITVLVPAIIILATRYGGLGGAIAWIALNSIYMALGAPLTHRKLLKGETRRWFTQDVLLPLAATLFFVGLGRKLITGDMSPAVTIFTLGILLVCSMFLAGLAAPQINAYLTSKFGIRD